MKIISHDSKKAMPRTLIYLLCAILLLPLMLTPTVSALSPEQKALYEKNILYYDLACSDVGPYSGNVSLDGETTGPPEAVQKVVWATLRNGGIDEMHVAAVMGNISHEGIWNPKQTEFAANIPGDESEDPSVVGSYGYGLIGWTPGTRLLDSMKEAGISGKPYTAETQAAVILAHIQGKTPSQYPSEIGKNFLATTTIEEATTAYQGTASQKGFENPADPVATLSKRIASAKEMLRKYKGSSFSASRSELDLESIAGNFSLHSAVVKEVQGKVVGTYRANQQPNTSPGSLKKLLIADAFLNTSPNLGKTVTITNQHMYGGGTPRGTVWDPKVGDNTTLKQSLRTMLSNSSNSQANVLITEAGGRSAINQKVNELGYKNSSDVGSLFKFNGGGGPSSRSTASDITKAMEKIFTSPLAKYSVAREGIQNSTYTFGLDSIANKWGGHDSFTGNSGVFNVNGKKYIITLFIEAAWDDSLPDYNYTATPSPSVGKIKQATKKIIQQLGGQAQAQQGSGDCACSATPGGTEGSVLDNWLKALAYKESGGDPKQPGSAGGARGKYQYIDSTWQSHAALYYPPAKQYALAHLAPEEVQDALVYIEYSKKFKEFDNDLFKLAISHFYPAANESPSLLDVVPPSNVITPRQYADDMIELIEKGGEWENIPLKYAEAPEFQRWLKKNGGDGASTPSALGSSSGGGCYSGSGAPTGQFAWPDDGRKDPLTSCFGQRWGRLHGGVDIGSPSGANVTAADGGEVEIASAQSGFGNTVVINHGNKFWTLYAHNTSLKVRVGDKVDQGQVIATVGATGGDYAPHIHFNIQTAGGADYNNAVDPLKHLPKDGRGSSGTNCPAGSF